MMRQERKACLQWYNTRLISVLRLLMGHVIHRRMKRDHYARLYTRLCATALLPIAMQRLVRHWQVISTHVIQWRLLARSSACTNHAIQARQIKRRKLAAAAHCARGRLFDRIVKRWTRGAREVRVGRAWWLEVL